MSAEEVKVGCFQMLLAILLGVNYVIVAMNHALPVFHNYAPEFQCQVGNGSKGCRVFAADNSTSAGVEGSKFASCRGNSGEIEGRSVATEWGLVCERKYLTYLGPSVYYVGVLMGAWIAGFLADRIGRLPVQAICLYTQGTLAVALYVVQDYSVFLAIRGLQGVFVQGLQNCTYILSLELFPARARTLVALLMQIAWASGLLLLAALSYVIPDWRILQLAVSVPTAITVLYIWIIPESPRWLLAKGKSTEADMAVERIGKYNGCCARKPKDEASAKSTLVNDTDANATPVKPERKSRVSCGDLSNAKNDDEAQHEATNLLDADSHFDQQRARKTSMKRITESIEEQSLDVQMRKKSGSNAEARKSDVPSTSRNGRRSRSVSRTISPSRTSLRNTDEIAEVKIPPENENGVEEIDEKVEKVEKVETDVEGKVEKKEENCLGLLKNPLFRKYGAIMVYQWFTSAIAGYFVESLLPNFNINRHLVFAMGGVLEVFAYCLAYFVLNKEGRRLSTSVYQFLNGVICVVVAGLLVLPNSSAAWVEIVKTVFLLLARAVAVSTIFIVYLYTIEVFPTVVRGSCLGLCTVFAKFGSLSTAQLLLSREHISIFKPIVVVGILCLLSGILAPILPETSNAILPDNFEEVARRERESRRKARNVRAPNNGNKSNEESTEREILQKKLFSEDWVDAGNGILVNFFDNKNAD